ncbi:HlyD family secretion protein [Chitinophaga niastensis]|uniref:HlyD family secretion protein n=1 Tax=Chitinophaga niastensis TaxID=536980 RepID=A0A2P8HEK2_CHINA|nr:HlyD family secretion protein [Chitinophaga niastensis]PSL44650.1 HlyD family secretion protein [Chitinophaga niastensis]
METNNIQYNVRSEEMQEIISNIPSWIVRTGSCLIFIILCVVISWSTFTVLPSTRSSKVQILTNPGISRILADSSNNAFYYLIASHTMVTMAQPIIFKGSAKEYNTAKQLLLMMQELSGTDQHLSPEKLSKLNAGLEQVGQQQINLTATGYSGGIRQLKSSYSKLHQWLNKKLIAAPVSGQIFFNDLQTGRELAYIIPEKAVYYGLLYLTQDNITAINIGQDVTIRLDGYQESIYGTLQGKIVAISDVPADNNLYLAKVALFPNKHNTGEKMIGLHPGAAGNAEIITGRESMFARAFFK